MIALSSTLTRMPPRRRAWRLSVWLRRLAMALVLLVLSAWVLHVVGHVHRACLRMQAQILEVSLP